MAGFTIFSDLFSFLKCSAWLDHAEIKNIKLDPDQFPPKLDGIWKKSVGHLRYRKTSRSWEKVIDFAPAVIRGGFEFLEMMDICGWGDTLILENWDL